MLRMVCVAVRCPSVRPSVRLSVPSIDSSNNAGLLYRGAKLRLRRCLKQSIAVTSWTPDPVGGYQYGSISYEACLIAFVSQFIFYISRRQFLLGSGFFADSTLNSF